jgi:hypothetical protein
MSVPKRVCRINPHGENSANHKDVSEGAAIKEAMRSIYSSESLSITFQELMKLTKEQLEFIAQVASVMVARNKGGRGTVETTPGEITKR